MILLVCVLFVYTLGLVILKEINMAVQVKNNQSNSKEKCDVCASRTLKEFLNTEVIKIEKYISYQIAEI